MLLITKKNKHINDGQYFNKHRIIEFYLFDLYGRTLCKNMDNIQKLHLELISLNIKLSGHVLKNHFFV